MDLTANLHAIVYAYENPTIKRASHAAADENAIMALDAQRIAQA